MIGSSLRTDLEFRIDALLDFWPTCRLNMGFAGLPCRLHFSSFSGQTPRSQTPAGNLKVECTICGKIPGLHSR